MKTNQTVYYVDEYEVVEGKLLKTIEQELCFLTYYTDRKKIVYVIEANKVVTTQDKAYKTRSEALEVVTWKLVQKMKFIEGDVKDLQPEEQNTACGADFEVKEYNKPNRWEAVAVVCTTMVVFFLSITATFIILN